MLNKKLNVRFILLLFVIFFVTMFSPKIGVNAHIIPKISEIKLKADAKQLHCMAKNIFYEAGGESIHGQAAVARVVLNRVAHGFAKTPCGVIYQTTIVEDKKICQFSWVCEDKGEPNINNERFKLAQQVAFEVMVLDMHKDIVPNHTLFFHNLTVNPLWPYAEVVRIGNHIFYSKFKKKNIVEPKKKAKEQNI